MGPMCDIMSLSETRITGAFLFAQNNNNNQCFGVKAPALSRQPACPSCLANRSKPRLDGAGAFAFKSTIDKAGRCANTRRPLTHTVGVTTMHAANDCTPHDPSGQPLPIELKNRIHNAAGNPAALTAILREQCPQLTPATAMAWLVDGLAFEAEAVRQAAELLNGEWSQEN